MTSSMRNSKWLSFRFRKKKMWYAPTPEVTLQLVLVLQEQVDISFAVTMFLFWVDKEIVCINVDSVLLKGKVISSHFLLTSRCKSRCYDTNSVMSWHNSLSVLDPVVTWQKVREVGAQIGPHRQISTKLGMKRARTGIIMNAHLFLRYFSLFRTFRHFPNAFEIWMRSRNGRCSGNFVKIRPHFKLACLQTATDWSFFKFRWKMVL